MSHNSNRNPPDLSVGRFKEIYIISELCGQWGGSIRRAEQMMLQSKLAGASAVKVQLFDTYKMPGENREKWEYLSMTKEYFLALNEFSKTLNMDFFASSFHEDRLEWIKEAGIKTNKIASYMHTNSDFCKKVIDMSDNVFISLGGRKSNSYPYESEKIIYMHCVPKYPHETIEAIELMPSYFEYPMLGYSDHCIGTEACKEAVRRGATVIEKHFTTCHSLQSKTESAHSCSMNMSQLEELRLFCDKEIK